jgi:hypothetical protein
MIHKRLGVGHRTSITRWRHHRPRKHQPSLHRDRTTVHQPGLGGVTYNVAYLGEDFGEVMSRWSLEHGEHWQAVIGGMIVVEPGQDVPRAFPTLAAAVSALLGHRGWSPDYTPGVKPKP